MTETNDRGLSPLQHGIVSSQGSEMFAAAALYDKTAEHQLTTGLFDTWNHNSDSRSVTDVDDRIVAKQRVVERFEETLKEPCRWTDEQQERLRGFVTIVEALNP